MWATSLVENPPGRIGYNEDSHASQDRRDEYLVEQINVVNEGVMLWAGSVMVQPGVRKISSCIGVAFLTGCQKARFHDGAVGIVGRKHIVYPMAVDADRFIRSLPRGGSLEELDGCAVEIGYIGVKNIRVYAILIHELLICVATGADLRRKQ